MISTKGFGKYSQNSHDHLKNVMILMQSGNIVEAEKILFSLGVSCEVINIHTIKPLDEKIILESIKKTKCAISCEEHNIIGGLGESISRLISEKHPIPFKVIGVNDSFGESGKPLDLLEKYNLNPESIKEAALEVIDKK